MWVYVCVYAYTHTNCTDGVLGCEPRGRKGHLEGLKNPDGLNLGIYVFVYVYKADTAPAAAGVATPAAPRMDPPVHSAWQKFTVEIILPGQRGAVVD